LASLLLNPAGIILPCLRKVNAMSGQLFSQTDENVQFNDAACAEKRPRLGSESNAKAATPTSVEILIRMLLIGGIKCFMMKRIRAAYHARNA
jgi:hypothetical protein